MRSLERLGIRLGLHRMIDLLERLGNPHRRLRFAHVAGTNGKGSTAAMLSAMLRAAGYRVGLYTSPHLESYDERVRIDGQPVPLSALSGALLAVKKAVGRGLDGEAPTEFEAVTAAAYLVFASARVDIVVQETGLGGRLDATNVVEEPEVVIVTPIALDHTDVLGHEIEKVAAEKAAVMKRGRPVVVGRQPTQVWSVILENAWCLECPLHRFGYEFTLSHVRVAWEGTGFDVNAQDGTYGNLFVPLPGSHQAENAACAVAAAEVLGRSGWRVGEPALREGLASVRWPGRMETVWEHPRVVLDVAHNPAGAWALASTLGQLVGNQGVSFVLGMLADKDAESFVEALAGVASHVVVTSTMGPRGRPASLLAPVVADAVTRGGPALKPTVVVEEDVDRAVRRAMDLAGRDGVVCVTGSFGVVGAARGLLRSWRNAEGCGAF